MLIMSAFWGAALAAILLVAMRTKRRYDVAVESFTSAAGIRRQDILERDHQNDLAFVKVVKAGEQTPGQASVEYCRERAALAIGAKPSAPAAWDAADLDRLLRHQVHGQCRQVGKRLISRAAVLLLGIVTAAGAATGVQYHLLSTGRTLTGAENSADAGLGALPSDPFAGFGASPANVKSAAPPTAALPASAPASASPRADSNPQE